jgi:hypothetical protein
MALDLAVIATIFNGTVITADEPDNYSYVDIVCGAGSIQIEDNGQCWYRTWDRTHGLSHEEELDKIPDDADYADIITHVAGLVDKIEQRFTWTDTMPELDNLD